MAEGLVQGEGFATDASMIKADAARYCNRLGESGIDWGDPGQVSRPVREYLAALEQANPIPPTPKRVSLTDPASTWTAAAGGPAVFAYSTNYLIDLKAGVIVDVEASAVSKHAQVETTKAMIDPVEEKFAIKPRRLVGDTNYDVAAMLGWLVDEKRIAPHVPVWDKSEHHDGTFSRTDFIFDASFLYSYFIRTALAYEFFNAIGRSRSLPTDRKRTPRQDVVTFLFIHRPITGMKFFLHPS